MLMRLHPPPDSHEPEHPVVAWVGIAAIVVAVLLIIWARFEVRGTSELESAFSGRPATVKPASKKAKPQEEAKRSEAENAAAKSRWATGFSH